MSDCFPSFSPGKSETHAQYNDIGMVLPWWTVVHWKSSQSEDLSWSQAWASWAPERCAGEAEVCCLLAWQAAKLGWKLGLQFTYSWKASWLSSVAGA